MRHRLHLGSCPVTVWRCDSSAAVGDEAEWGLQPALPGREQPMAEAEVALADTPRCKLHLRRQVAPVALGAEDRAGRVLVQAVEQTVGRGRVQVDGVPVPEPPGHPVLQRTCSTAGARPPVAVVCLVRLRLPHRDGPACGLPQGQHVPLLAQDARLPLPVRPGAPAVVLRFPQRLANLLLLLGALHSPVAVQTLAHRAQDPRCQAHEPLHGLLQARERLEQTEDVRPHLDVRGPQGAQLGGLQRRRELSYGRRCNRLQKRCVMDGQTGVRPDSGHKFLNRVVVNATHRRSRKRRHQWPIAQR
mmetsp:Transcript_83743/g.261656  ORF Transcript_83743/g.261656 Transcript_83743/m.261656 type:complete len:302 (-) Transcript_83743:191-1096(-)